MADGCGPGSDAGVIPGGDEKPACHCKLGLSEQHKLGLTTGWNHCKNRIGMSSEKTEVFSRFFSEIFCCKGTLVVQPGLHTDRAKKWLKSNTELGLRERNGKRFYSCDGVSVHYCICLYQSWAQIIGK